LNKFIKENNDKKFGSQDQTNEIIENLINNKDKNETNENKKELNINSEKNILEKDEVININKQYPFVKVEVPQSLVSMFIAECIWYKDKKGEFPSIEDQVAILKSLTR
jgi:hypothetical protein